MGMVLIISRLVNRDARKSKKVPSEERTQVTIRWIADIKREVDNEGAPIGYRPVGPGEEFLVIEQTMDGRLEGLAATIRVDLSSDGELMLTSIQYTPTEPMPLASIGTRALRELRHGDMLEILEKVLVRVTERDEPGAAYLPYLTAVRRHKLRPGRGGTPDIVHAEVAQRRIQAEEKAPRRAIKYMVETWPGDFTTESAAHSKINRAKRKGMLEGSGKALELTDKAIALLEGTPS